MIVALAKIEFVFAKVFVGKSESSNINISSAVITTEQKLTALDFHKKMPESTDGTPLPFLQRVTRYAAGNSLAILSGTPSFEAPQYSAPNGLSGFRKLVIWARVVGFRVLGEADTNLSRSAFDVNIMISLPRFSSCFTDIATK